MLKVSAKSPLLEQTLATELQRKGYVVESSSPRSSISEVHYSKGAGALGEVTVIDDHNPMIKMLAEALKVPDGWKLTKIKNGLWGAYNAGDRLVLFTNEGDFQEDEI